MFSDAFCKEKLEMFLSVNEMDLVLPYLLQVTLAKNSEEALCVIMASINKKFKKDLNDNNIAVWLGLDHTGNKTGELALVCFHSADTVATFSERFELRVIFRRFDETEMEPMESRLKEKRETSFTKHDVAAIKRLISEHGKNLFTIHSNLEAISASPIRSTKHGILNETSIVLYCRLKGVIPYGEEFFPKELEVEQQRYPTDIREGFFSLGMRRAQRQRSNPHPNFVNNPLRMGCSIGVSGFQFAGTLGPFVRLDDSNIGFLTCAHVLGIKTSSPNRKVVQPSDIETGLPGGRRLCGTFVRENFDTSTAIGVDAALVRIDRTKRNVALGLFVWRDSNQPRNIGMFAGNSPSFVDGEVIGNPDLQRLWERRDVCKFGRSTGLTQGLLLLENAMLRVHDAHLSLPDTMPLPHGHPNNNFIMKGQFIIQNVGTEPFFTPGDSGAGVYVIRNHGHGESKLALIGIATGSLTTGECVMTPIGIVLEALQLEETDIITEGSMDIDP
ncbi:hypothetical protein ACJMK2_012143 [Sinanodonta woodiana]|uniref:Uncharacterized protein n=1 Tax=Sinanodonta woodiana TaxID=1069815 RepID=A0ABD3V7J7_SINWO